MQVQLAGPTDLPGFRAQARALLAQQVAPGDVHWATAADASDDLFAGTEAAEPTLPSAAASPATATVPASFVQLCEEVVLHSDAARFALLYRLLWRLVHEPTLRHDPLDADMLRARQMGQAVRRDMHKMKAFVRFRQLHEQGPQAPPLHVAWFEPEHHIVQAVAPWFARRFATMRWAILTPQCCARWQPGELTFGPGARREDAPPADAGEALWLTYYQSIFNPARLKLQMMQKEMPRKYWHNLPEAQLIAPLAAQAHQRTHTMIDNPATQPRRAARAAPVAVQPVDAPHMPHTPVDSLASLQAATRRCRECPIGAMATQSVIGEGPIGARLMFVGEQPGDQEDLQGRPFVGPAGQLFDRALEQLQVDRKQVFIANAVKHFKFELRGKRRIHQTPTQREAAACLHWLEAEIALVKPQRLVALGATAARALLGRPVPVLANRGQWLARADGLQVLVTLHPSALLRMPAPEQAGAFEQFVADLRQATGMP